MKHPLTLNAVLVMLVGVYLILQFGWSGSKMLEEAGSLTGLKAFSRGEKVVTAVCGLMILLGLNLLALATPYWDWSVPGLIVSTIGTAILLVSLVIMILHLSASPEVFPFRQFATDMVVFCGGMAVLSLSFWL